MCQMQKMPRTHALRLQTLQTVHTLTATTSSITNSVPTIHGLGSFEIAVGFGIGVDAASGVDLKRISDAAELVISTTDERPAN